MTSPSKRNPRLVSATTEVTLWPGKYVLGRLAPGSKDRHPEKESLPRRRLSLYWEDGSSTHFRLDGDCLLEFAPLGRRRRSVLFQLRRLMAVFRRQQMAQRRYA